MPISKSGIHDAPQKSPYNFERYDSELEHFYMEKLDADPLVARWTKKHGVSIPFIATNGRKRQYRPDFLVEMIDGARKLVEVKNPQLTATDEVQRKRRAAEEWCLRRGMSYEMATIKGD